VPYEVDLQATIRFRARAGWGLDPVTASSMVVKLSYAALFIVVLVAAVDGAGGAELALGPDDARDPRQRGRGRGDGQGRDPRHLQIFILGSAVCGIAGAMMTTLDGQLTPGTYQPLRFTFLIWVMVIVGGSGNNFGAVLGGFLIWFLWVRSNRSARADAADHRRHGRRLGLKEHLLDSPRICGCFTMGMILLLVLRFSPRGLIPER
jgi:branched-chain amino acid transport system permease protein